MSQEAHADPPAVSLKARVVVTGSALGCELPAVMPAQGKLGDDRGAASWPSTEHGSALERLDLDRWPGLGFPWSCVDGAVVLLIAFVNPSRNRFRSRRCSALSLLFAMTSSPLLSSLSSSDRATALQTWAMPRWSSWPCCSRAWVNATSAVGRRRGRPCARHRPPALERPPRGPAGCRRSSRPRRR